MPVERIRPATGGQNTDASPEYVGAAQAPGVTDLLTGRDGKLVMRGPINEWSAAMLATSNPLAATWTFTDPTGWTNVGRVAVARSASEVSIADVGEVAIGAPATVAAMTNKVPANRRHARVGAYVYGRSTGDKLVQWDGDLAAADWTLHTTAPTRATDVLEHLERLLVLGGTVPDAAAAGAYHSDYLYYSDAGGPTTDLLTRWQDDVSGLTNQLVLPEAGAGLCRVGKNTAIFGLRGTHMLLGSTPSTWALRTVLSHTTAISADAAIAYKEGCFFLSTEGLYWFDGYDATLVSGPVQSALTEVANLGWTGTIVPSLAILRGGLLHVVIRREDGALLFSMIYDINARAWWWGMYITAISAGGFSFRASGYDVSFNGEGLMRLQPIPESVDESQRGFDFVRSDIGDNEAIQSAWSSRLVRLGMPSHRAVVRRLMIDYVFVSATAAAGWYVELRNGNNDVLLAEQQLPVTGTTPSNVRSRHVIDLYAETDDARVSVSWRYDGAGDAPPVEQAEIHDVWIEYEPAQQRSSY